MSKLIPGNSKHLTLEDRIFIESSLNSGHSFKDISKTLCKDPSTISREVRNHQVRVASASSGKAVNYCMESLRCKKTNLCNRKGCVGTLCRKCPHCNKNCPDFKPNPCYRRMHGAPYVCNGCPSRSGCRQSKVFYRAANADDEYRRTLSDSRAGLNITPDELERLDRIVSPLIRKGQPVYHVVCNNRDEIHCCTKTIYNYINGGALSADRMTLPRAVKYKPRHTNEARVNIPRKAREGRTYADFKAYLNEHLELASEVVQMDTVMGPKGSTVSMLTLYFCSCAVQLSFLLDEHTAQNVGDTFDFLEMRLGTDLFRKAFLLVLTDNGSEFSNPEYLEHSADGSRRTRIYYCEPYSSWQKGECEKNHEFIRYVIPKGTDLGQFTQADINKLMNHINSTSRPRFNGMTPYQLAKIYLGDDFISKIGMRRIAPKDVNLTPGLLK